MHPGDTLTILLEGEPLTLQVVGIYRENSSLGRVLMLPAETLRRVWPDFEADSYLLKLPPGADAQATATALTSASNDLLEVLVAGEGGLPGTVAALPMVTSALSLLPEGIAVAGVVNGVWMGAWERRRELALLEAVRMTPEQVTLSVLVAAAGTESIGYTVGLPVGLGGIRLLMNTVARGVGL